jgi:hypothetical protein
MSIEAGIQNSAAVRARTVDASRLALWGISIGVFLAQLTFALVMNSRDYLWGDAISRSSSALIALYSNDPHLAAIGFVWMPLPVLLEIVPAFFYRWWPDVVSSGFASSLITALAGTLTSIIVFCTARRFSLSVLLSSIYTLLVSLSPMLFLFSTNGMSEGLAAPFMIGSVCCLVLFWQDGERRYVAASGILLALAFACIYQAVNFGAVLLVAMLAGLFTAENAPSFPQGRLRAVEGLTILFLVPSIYVGILWVVANAAIMGDPLYFATSEYSNEGYIAATGAGRLSDAVVGDLGATLWFSIIRTAPFFIPIVAILLVRVSEGRLLRLNTLMMTGLSLCVPFGLITLQLYDGTSFGWLRYFMYPLYVAAGWGLYEIGKSKRRNLAIALVFAGWLISAPVSLWAMADPELGQNEYQVVRSIWTGETAAEVGYPLYFRDILDVSAAIDSLEDDALVLADSSNAWTIAATVNPDTLKHTLVLSSDDRFHDALEDPASVGVRYLLVPSPKVAPADLLNAEYPDLWAGNDPRFSLTHAFDDTGVGWRLYEVKR